MGLRLAHRTPINQKTTNATITVGTNCIIANNDSVANCRCHSPGCSKPSATGKAKASKRRQQRKLMVPIVTVAHFAAQ